MADLNSLHDEIDQLEDYVADAEAAVAAVRARVESIVSDKDDFPSMLEAIALEVENSLAEITTSAARAGLTAGSNRRTP
jgi:hypothetical protein